MNAVNENVIKWAEKLDGRRYGNELSRDEEKELKDRLSFSAKATI